MYPYIYIYIYIYSDIAPEYNDGYLIEPEWGKTQSSSVVPPVYLDL